MVMGMKPAKGKPLFYGEVGLGEGQTPAKAGQVIRDSVWSGLMAGHAGAAQFWYWDEMSPARYADYRRFTSFAKAHGLTEGRFLTPFEVQIKSRTAGAVTFAPGQGWAKTTKFQFDMPADAYNGALGKLAGFIQGPGKKDMMAEPIRFSFVATSPGRFEMGVATVAKAGATIQIALDGAPQVNFAAVAQDRDYPLNSKFGVEFGPGKHTVTVSNPGPDWFVASSFKIDGIGHAVMGSASREGDRALLWLDRSTFEPERFSLSGLPKAWKKATIYVLDLDTGTQTQRQVGLIDGILADQKLLSNSAIWLVVKR